MEKVDGDSRGGETRRVPSEAKTDKTRQVLVFPSSRAAGPPPGMKFERSVLVTRPVRRDVHKSTENLSISRYSSISHHDSSFPLLEFWKTCIRSSRRWDLSRTRVGLQSFDVIIL